MTSTPSVVVRPVGGGDFSAWLPLWDGYNAFYGRQGDRALDPAITGTTWARFLAATEPVHGLVAESEGRLLGLAYYLFHRSTTRIEPTCYLQDLFVDPSARGLGIGQRLIEAVCDRARGAGAFRVYWQTHETNAQAMALYDKVASRTGFLVYGTAL